MVHTAASWCYAIEMTQGGPRLDGAERCADFSVRCSKATG
eukprot:COSAG02_NODE_58422_length_277_cov_0.870787_2_plen_39_part_01